MSISLPYKEDVERWSVEQVAAWHQQREIPEAADIYLRQGIDGHQMLTLPESKLVALFWEFSIRKRTEIINLINQIKSQPTVPHRKSHSNRFANQNYKKCSPTQINSQNSSSKSAPNSSLISNGIGLLSTVGANGLEFEDMKYLPYADDSSNEDYLVPLSAGSKMMVPPPPPPSKGTKKELCSSPGQNGFKVKNRIQENVDELNEYEIINESPTDNEATKSSVVDDRELVLIKPPDLPNRNSVPSASVPNPTVAPQSTTPLVPPRTRSVQQHQKLNSFHHLHHQSSSTKVGGGISRTPVRKEVLHQSTPLPKPPKQTGSISKKPKEGGAPNSPVPRRIISSPILTSSTVASIQQPLQMINLAANRTHCSVGSELPKVQTLILGSGKSVPMNSLYESLLHENYFHAVVRNVLPKLFTKDKMFLVRPSTHSEHPLTLSLQENGKILNISIRVRKDAKYSLGTEKPGEMAFSTVGEMIDWHRREPIKLEGGGLTYLMWSPPKTEPIVR